MSCRDSHPVMCGPSNFPFRKSGHRLIRNQRSPFRLPYNIFAREISDGQRHLVSFDQTLQKGLSYLSWRHVIFRLLVNERKNISFVTVTGVVESLGIFVFSSPSNALWFLFFFSAPFLCACLFSFSIFSSCSSLLVNLVSPYTEFFPFFLSRVFFFSF